MVKVNLLGLVVLASVLVAAPATAQTLPPPVVGGAYLDDMARMDAELSVLRKRQEIRQAQEAISGVTGTASKMPKVLATYMSEGRLIAEIMYDHGLVTRVRGGESIPGDLVVVSVAQKGVTVRANGKKIMLDYAVRSAVAAPVESMMPSPAPMAAPMSVR